MVNRRTLLRLNVAVMMDTVGLGMDPRTHGACLNAACSRKPRSAATLEGRGILNLVKDRNAEDWEELARREPYFAVLTHDDLLGVQSSDVATTAFFETGEDDIASLLATIASVRGRRSRVEERH